jgi:hypothetical protein
MNSFLWIVFGSETFQRRVKVIVHRKRDLEDIESVSINMFERMLLIILNRFLERADVLGTLDLDRENVTGVIAENQSIELQYDRHATSEEFQDSTMKRSKVRRVESRTIVQK